MRVTIKKGTAHGTVAAPPSKSMAHRLLICAGLCRGKSVIRGVEGSQDVLATLDCLRAIGAKCELEGDTVTVYGTDFAESGERTLNCRESGSTLRFFIPISMLFSGKTRLCGSETLLSRPLDVYKNICRAAGLPYKQGADFVEVGGRLASGNFKIPGNISSQFISGLLFALPLLSGDSLITIAPPIESRSYIELTLGALKKFGVEAYWKNERTLFVAGGQSYKCADVTVEADYSNAAFFSVLNSLGSEVTVTGLDPESGQGDKAYKEFFPMLERGTPSINISDCPDLGPVLFALAAAKHGGVFTGTHRLKIKESDRGAAMAGELAKFGVCVTVGDDDIVVYPAKFHAPDAPLESHNDHRIVMALCALLTLFGGSINGAQAVNKSFPDYFNKLAALGIEVEKDDA